MESKARRYQSEQYGMTSPQVIQLLTPFTGGLLFFIVLLKPSCCSLVCNVTHYVLLWGTKVRDLLTFIIKKNGQNRLQEKLKYADF